MFMFLLVFWLNTQIHFGFASRPPNILFVITDAFDGRILSEKTKPVALPNLEKLQRAGTTFTRTYCASPLCVPSRAALFSGRHIHKTESWNNFRGLSNGVGNWTEDLKKEFLEQNLVRYKIGLFGKIDDHSGDHSESERIEAWTSRVQGLTLRQEPRPTVELLGNQNTKKVQLKDWMRLKKVRSFIKKASKNSSSPWLAYYGINLPHPYRTNSAGPNAGGSTFKTSPYYLKKVDKSKIKAPVWKKFQDLHPVDQYAVVTKNCSGSWSNEEILEIRAYYFAMLAEVDAILGELFRSIPNLNETVVFFTSDHGDLAMEHQQYYKMSFYEGSVRVPLIAAGPPFKSDMRKHEPRSLLDIYPTLLSLANTTTEHEIDGLSLLPDKRISSNRPVLAQYHAEHMNASGYMIVQGDYKFIFYSQHRYQLFDLKNDPEELHEIQDENIARKLRRELLKHLDVQSVTEKVERYNKESFLQWRNQKGEDYEDAISNLRWAEHFNENKHKNLALIDRWLYDLPTISLEVDNKNPPK
ncbi:Oidioi.mRNA.OKI2018_I69.chr2.g4484.t1.cds [Oikopleura dioica]|uniref:Oidioi.mRNA.OKI2018_I69.chr2.g4484.t1.cds n=1 Tax=Oikopleura dioica TaxID=34765 RepID=A0ABN7T3X2_OIKDI|nr:Oidioi.mRNA.OKI2018_I69.chr2.g4484.t1.cds [Oikopleura dioica]